MSEKVNKSDQEWKQELTPEQYQVLRKKGTERPFTGDYWKTKDKGTYQMCRMRKRPVRFGHEV